MIGIRHGDMIEALQNTSRRRRVVHNGDIIQYKRERGERKEREVSTVREKRV
jgi:hypothetical protein